jgi:hypothetical protein
VDTRDPIGPSGGPALDAGSARVFTVVGRCGVPSTARAVAFNVAVASSTDPGFLVVYPSGITRPPTSSLNYRAGQSRANNVLIGLGPAGDIVVYCGQSAGTAQAIIDVAGYFE